jgi:hypothetical protein
VAGAGLPGIGFTHEIDGAIACSIPDSRASGNGAGHTDRCVHYAWLGFNGFNCCTPGLNIADRRTNGSTNSCTFSTSLSNHIAGWFHKCTCIA